MCISQFGGPTFFHSHWCRPQRSRHSGLWESGIQCISHPLSKLLSYRQKIPDVPSLCIGLLLGWFNDDLLIKPLVRLSGKGRPIRLGRRYLQGQHQ